MSSGEGRIIFFNLLRSGSMGPGFRRDDKFGGRREKRLQPKQRLSRSAR